MDPWMNLYHPHDMDENMTIFVSQITATRGEKHLWHYSMNDALMSQNGTLNLK